MTPGVRVTILGLNYAPEPTGNAPYTTAVAEHFARSGNRVRVVTAFPHYPQWQRQPGFVGHHLEEETNGVTISRLSHYVPRSPRGARRLVSEVSFGLRQTFSRWGTSDAIVLVSPALFASATCMVRAVLGRRKGRVLWVQDLYSQGMAETGEGAGAAARVAVAVERWTLGHAHAVVAIHEVMAARMRDHLGVAPERIQVIPNWSHFEPSEKERNDARASLSWDPSLFIALYAGNMGRKQGLENVVEAARCADRASDRLKFVLLGDGAERRSLEKLGRGINSLQFVSPLSSELFPAALAAADVLIVSERPGVKEMAVPSKLTSYFAAGRPVIAAGEPDGIVAGIMRESGSGPTVSSGDPQALADAVVALRADDRARHRFSTAARDYWRTRMSSVSALSSWDATLTKAIERHR